MSFMIKLYTVKVIFEKLIIIQTVKKIPAFYGSAISVSVFNRRTKISKP
jgi:hypothetical protein